MMKLAIAPHVNIYLNQSAVLNYKEPYVSNNGSVFSIDRKKDKLQYELESAVLAPGSR
jgi:hypothetical protein